LTRALQDSGMTIDDVVTVPYDIPDHVVAYESLTVDAVVTYEPSLTKLLEQGARPVFTSKDIPGEIVDVLMVRAGLIEKRPRILETFLTGWMLAVEKFRADPASAAKLLSRRERVTPQAFLEALEGIELYDAADNRRLMRGPNPDLLEVVRRHERVMLDHNLLKRKVVQDELVNGWWLE